MYLSATFRIYPTKTQEMILENLIRNFSIETNRLIQTFIQNRQVNQIKFKDINNSIPWDSKIEIIKLAKVEFVKIMENGNIKKNHTYNYCKWTNFNFQYFNDQRILIQTFSKDVMIVDVFCNEYVREIISSYKLTSLRIFKKNMKWLGSFTYDYIPRINNHNNLMGIDLGIKVPAVVATSTGKIRFFGNGRMKRYIHSKQKSHHRSFSSKSTKGKDIRSNKWSNKLRDMDHKISKEIVEFAVSEEVKVIKLENLGKLQKHNSNIKVVNTWSYHRLLTFIVYKAEKEGIQVYLIDPKNTSKKCPNCSKINKINGRKYLCECGYSKHRDIVGAINILNTKL